MKKMAKKIFDRLENLYQTMDRAWEKAALYYGFQCSGCNENCCETEFYHHTLIEKDYLLHGFNKLSLPLSIAAIKRAKKVCTKREIAIKNREQIRIMCPLNQEGKCILYHYRPMICRLHGIPHEVLKPGYSSVSTPVLNPGCKAGSELFNSAGYIQFDRTPFYSEMAEIEREYLTTVIGRVTRIKQTIAQMLVKS